MATLTVGQGQQYARISEAVAAAANGDVVAVQAGTYYNDFASFSKNITLTGVGGMVNMVATQSPPNGKAIFTLNGNVTLDHFSFSGAQVRDENGAGIRYEGGNLVVRNSLFVNNQNGILAGADPNGTILIENSEFDHNGAGNGSTHNLYVTDIKSLVIRDSYFHDAVVGHEIKSRARSTTITGSRVFDNGGNASYSVDLPNGGVALLENNIIQQGVNSPNSGIITFGIEGNVHAVSSLTIRGNTILNDKVGGTVVRNHTPTPVQLINNTIWGVSGTPDTYGPVQWSGTTVLSTRPTLNASSPVLPYTDTPVPAPTPIAVPTPVPVPTPTPVPVPTPTPPPAGTDRFTVYLSGDEWQGAPQFVFTVDGRQVGGTQAVTASHRTGGSDAFTFDGEFGSGPHTLGVSFINDTWGGTTATDRNLYVDGISYNGNALPNATAELFSNRTATFNTPGAATPTTPTPVPTPEPVPTPTPPAAGTDRFTAYLSGDEWQGAPQFIFTVDGEQVGGTQTVSASHRNGGADAFTFDGAFGSGPHTLGVSFINDTYGGTAATDRNLYVDSISYNGAAVPNSSASLFSNGTATFAAPGTARPTLTPAPTPTPPPAGTDRFTLNMSAHEWQGAPQFIFTVDGRQVGGTQAVTAPQRSGGSEAFTFDGAFGSGSHTLGVSFVNDTWGGSEATDRNLFVNSILYNGAAVPNSSASLFSNGTATFTVPGTPTPVPVPTPTPPAAAIYQLEGPKWPVNTVTYSYANSTYAADAAAPFSSPIGDAYRPVVQSAFQRWADVSGITFREVADSSDPNQAADVRIGFGNLNTADTRTVGMTNYRYTNGSAGAVFRPDVVVRLEDPSQLPLVTVNGSLTYQGLSTTLYQVALHEIGHSIGLGHSSDPASVMAATVGSSNQDLNSGDIAGARALYGNPGGGSGAIAEAVAAAMPLSAAGEDTVSVTGQPLGGTAPALSALHLPAAPTFNANTSAGIKNDVIPLAGGERQVSLDAATLNTQLLSEALAVLEPSSKSGSVTTEETPSWMASLEFHSDSVMGELLPMRA